MKQYLINNNSNKLLLFFAGWGCDEHEFEHLSADCDVLLCYDYTDLKFDFDFSKYKEANLLGFSAGVFVSSVVNFKFKLNKKIALSGNPYLFDEYFGLSKHIRELLYNVTEENADEFVRNYLVKTEDEYKIFRHSKRTTESCREELNSLKIIYEKEKANIKNIFDFTIIGEDDTIFNVAAQKEFYKEKLKTVKNARHNLFFRIKNYQDILNL